MSTADKALKAVRDYARLTGEIKRLKSVIAESLGKCAGVNGHLQPLDLDAFLNDLAYDIAWKKHYNDVTHLKAAYTPEPLDEGGSDYLSGPDLLEFLSECPHCLAAHEAIQARKSARRSLGATKRFITRLGNAA